MSKVRFPNATGAKTFEGLDIIQWSEYYPAEIVERLVEAARKAPHDMGCSSLQGGPTTKDWGKLSRCDCWKKAALEPFKGDKND